MAVPYSARDNPQLETRDEYFSKHIEPYLEKARQRDEDRKKEMAQALAYGGPGATILTIPEMKRGLTSKALANRLRAAGLTVQNIEIIQELLRLTREG
jgi:hypothetical protein